MLGYQAIPALLQRHGLRTVFSVLAETNGPWIAHGVRQGQIDLVRTRHEETAVMAAVGHARSTGRVGVASVTRGPGLANSVNAIRAAVDVHVPIMVLTADGPRPLAQTQNLEQRTIVAALGADYRPVGSATELPDAIASALRRARWKGTPQVLAIHQEALDGELELPRGGIADEGDSGPAPIDHAGISAAAGLLTDAERPLLIAGHGALMAGAADDLIALAEATGARLGTTLMALGMFSGHPADIGIVGGWASRAARDHFATVDAVVAFGATLNRFTMDRGLLFPRARVAQVSIDRDELGSFLDPSIAVVGDAGAAAGALLHEWRERGGAPRPHSGPDRAATVASVLDARIGHDPARGLDTRAVLHRLDELLPPDRIIVTDAGRAVVPAAALLGARDARSWLHGRGYGSIGQGLGLAIGAAVAHPHRRIVLFVGDGAFLLASHDLDAVRLAGLGNLAVVVLNDQRYGMEVGRLQHYGLPLDTITQPTPDLVALARVFGGEGVRVSTADELTRLTLPEADRFFLIDARIDPDADPTMSVGDGAGAK